MELPVLGLRLSEDQWFAQNTLPFIFRHLDVRDLQRCSEVCKLWYNIAKDSSLWRSVTLRNYNINFPKMSEALACLKTVHLRIEDCEVESYHLTLYMGLKNMVSLRVLEMVECSYTLMDVLEGETPKLEVIRASFRPRYSTKFNLSFVSKMSSLRELKLDLCDGIQDIEGILTNLGNLRHLYLLGISIDFQIPQIFRVTKNATLETLALGDCRKLTKEFCVILKSLTALKKLRLEHCTDWNALYCLTCLSEMPSLVCLELIEVDIDKGFPGGLKLCTNLEQLTIYPKSHRFNMGIFNARILVCVGKLKATLKKFTLGFSESYLNYFVRVMGVENQVPISRDFQVDILNLYRDFIKLDVFEELRDLLPYSCVKIDAPGKPKSIFS